MHSLVVRHVGDEESIYFQIQKSMITVLYLFEVLNKYVNTNLQITAFCEVPVRRDAF